MNEQPAPQIKFYCDCCEKHQPVDIEPLRRDALNEEAWGDIVCRACHLVIATFSAEQEGHLVYILAVKVEPFPPIPETSKQAPKRPNFDGYTKMS